MNKFRVRATQGAAAYIKFKYLYYLKNLNLFV